LDLFEQPLRVGEGPFIADEYGRFVEGADFLGHLDIGSHQFVGCGGRSAANQALSRHVLGAKDVRGQLVFVLQLLDERQGHAFGVDATKCLGHDHERAVFLA
jgi:hypothetical protein